MIHSTNKQAEEIINKVCEWLIWYENNSSKGTIEQLLNFQDRVSILSVNLAEIAGQTKGSYLRAYFERKVTHSITKLALIENGDKIGTAEEKALKSVTGLKQDEMNAEEATYTINLQLKQVNKVLSACAQRISYAKSEKDRMIRQEEFIKKTNN